MTKPAPDEPARPRPDRDQDLADHDLTDHDEVLFHRPVRPWRHLTTIGAALLLVSLVLAGGAATHLGNMSGRTIANAVLLPVGKPVNIRLDAGEQRMLYTQRGSGMTRCQITDERDAPVSVETTSPVILQGSDVLWHGQSLFTAPKGGDYTIQCEGGADARVGRPVGTLDVILTVLAAGIGGLGALAGLGVLLWGRARRRGRARARRA
ncbi:MAG: hypothetical protein IPK37_07375 [Austwickia sp.]|jgi:hypothetical protein|nr:MAG: hypothetical protein IPK37_07375 [Austwickia sp.]